MTISPRRTNVRTGTVQLPTLAEDLDALQAVVREKMGEEDLAHIRKVAAYSRAIEDRATALITQGTTPRQVWRGAVLRALHTLLEFSELGHNILHGSYDGLEHLDPGGPFHSERWSWDFVADEREWRVMHHQNHHPHTNIAGKDHDLGYSIGRWMDGQDWYAHHAGQVALLGLFALHVYPFALYTATSAARTEGRPVLSSDTFAAAAKRVAQHMRKNYVTQPRAAGWRGLQTLVGNYLGTVLGYDLALFILAIEHHAENVELFPDPGPSESESDFYARQLRATTNFTDGGRAEDYFRALLEQEVPFDDRPDFRVFYGGLDTHIEHHLFPDLPCARQRELASEVRRIAARHGLPYNEAPLEALVADFVARFARMSVPAGENERKRDLLRRPKALARRVFNGLRYRSTASDAAPTYLKTPRRYEVDAAVQTVRRVANGDAVVIAIARPEAWRDHTWPPGAYLSIRLAIDGTSLVRQYSLLRESASANRLEIAVRRVPGGRVSNRLVDTLQAGDTLRLVSPPSTTGGLALPRVPAKALYLAGGIGITPMLAMLRHQERVAPHHDAALLYFNRTDASTLFVRELEGLRNSCSLAIHRFVDGPADAAHHARISEGLLAETVPDIAERDVFLCGPAGFMNAAQSTLRALGVPSDRIHEESFAATAAEEELTGRTHAVALLRSGVTLDVDEGQTVLAAAKEAGVTLPTGCERGLCRACVCSKRSGATLTGETTHDGTARVTLCNTYPRSPVTLDA